MLDFFKRKLEPSPEKSGNIPARMASLMKPGSAYDGIRIEQKKLVDLVLASGDEGIETFRQCLEDAFAMRAGRFQDIWYPALDIAKETRNQQLFKTIEKVTRVGRDLIQGYPHPPRWMPELETDIMGGGKFGWHDGMWKPIAHGGIEFLIEHIPSLPHHILPEHRAAAFDTCTYHITRWEAVKKSGEFQSLQRVEEEISYWTSMRAHFQADGVPQQLAETSSPRAEKEGIPFPGIITDVITDFQKNSLDVAVIISLYDEYIRDSIQRINPDIRIFSFGGSRDEQQRWVRFLSGTGGEEFSFTGKNVIIAREGLVMGIRDASVFFSMLTEVRGKHLGFYLFYEYSRDTYRELESMFSRSRSGNLKINVYGLEGLLYSCQGRPDSSLKKATCGYMGLLSNNPECDSCTYRVECRNNGSRKR